MIGVVNKARQCYDSAAKKEKDRVEWDMTVYGKTGVEGHAVGLLLCAVVVRVLALTLGGDITMEER